MRHTWWHQQASAHRNNSLLRFRSLLKAFFRVGVCCCCLPAADVDRFLLGKHSVSCSRLQNHLSPKTVGTWLTTASKCGLNKLVQICIDYSVGQSLPVDMDLLTGLQPSHANKLLAAKESQASNHKSRLDKVTKQLGSSSLTHYSCSACGRSWLSRFDDMCVFPTALRSQPAFGVPPQAFGAPQQALSQQNQQSKAQCSCQPVTCTVAKAAFIL